jgi:hypothetical protein
MSAQAFALCGKYVFRTRVFIRRCMYTTENWYPVDRKPSPHSRVDLLTYEKNPDITEQVPLFNIQWCDSEANSSCKFALKQRSRLTSRKQTLNVNIVQLRQCHTDWCIQRNFGRNLDFRIG